MEEGEWRHEVSPLDGRWCSRRPSLRTQISEAVHAKGSFIYLQLWAMGRAARSELLRKETPEFGAVAPSPIPLSTTPNDVPHELTIDGALLLSSLALRVYPHAH